MNIDPVLAQLIVTAIVAVPVYLKMRSEWRKATADADSSNVKDSLELKREYKADLAELEVKYEALVVKFNQLQAEIQIEKSARAADRDLHDDEIAKLRLELHSERSARGVLESKLIEANQRISALEDELDKRDRRIKELESNSGTSPAVRPSGFGTK
jgi:predicted RNase H-like nuclease (RuvC/YqgF family)